MAYNAHGPAPPTSGTRNFVWCVPRSGSTALTKCLSGIDGMEVWFEPFCFCFIAKVKSKNFLGRTLPEQEFKGHVDSFRHAANVLKRFNGCDHKPEHLSYTTMKHKLECSSSRHVLAKDMAFALSKEQYHLIPKGYCHSFFIRHPLRVFHSNRKGMIAYLSERGQYEGDPEEFDLLNDDPLMTPGLLFKDIYNIWCYVRENFDPNPIVIDGDDLLSNPADVLPKYCRSLGIPYSDDLMTWDGSAESTKEWISPLKRGEDLKSICSSFYQTSMSSIRFFPPKLMPSRDQVSPDVLRYTDEVIGYYNKMYSTRLI